MVLLVVLLPVLFVLATYAINIAYVEAVNAEVQIVADAAVQAAGREYVQTQDPAKALIAAQAAASRNPVSGNVIPIQASDLEFGVSVRSSLATGYSFTAVGAGEEGNAVRLTTNALHNAGTPVISPVFPTMGSSMEIRPLRTAISTQSTMDVSLVIDRSGSMAYASDEEPDPDNNPAAAPPGWQFGDAVPPNSRWLDLVASAEAFCQYLNDSPQQEQLSLSTYSHTFSTNTKLTYTYGDVMNALGGISAGFNGGSTDIGSGILEGLAALKDPALERPYAVKVMVVLTDGRHNTGTSPEYAASQLASNGGTLFTITFSDGADQARMKSIAENCGGAHFHATDAAQLTQAFEEIAKRLPSLMTL